VSICCDADGTTLVETPTLDLTDEEREALIRFLWDGIDRDRFPLSPRLALIPASLENSPYRRPPSRDLTRKPSCRQHHGKDRR